MVQTMNGVESAQTNQVVDFKLCSLNPKIERDTSHRATCSPHLQTLKLPPQMSPSFH